VFIHVVKASVKALANGSNGGGGMPDGVFIVFVDSIQPSSVR
jgi:hypothetical protein